MTTWPYLIVFNDKLGTRKEVQEFLDTVPEVTYWYACLPNSVFFTARVSAKAISEKINAKFGTDSGKRHFITEIAADREGWMPKSVWHLVKNPDKPRLDE